MIRKPVLYNLMDCTVFEKRYTGNLVIKQLCKIILSYDPVATLA